VTKVCVLNYDICVNVSARKHEVRCCVYLLLSCCSEIS